MKAGILERHLGELDRDPCALAHLADGGGETPRAAIGDRTVQVALARLEHDVDHLLLGDRIADLHRRAHRFGRLVRQLDG